jgi:hypothetical protein
MGLHLDWAIELIGQPAQSINCYATVSTNCYRVTYVNCFCLEVVKWPHKLMCFKQKVVLQ